MPKHFLCLTDWSRADLDALFALAGDLKARHRRGEAHRLLAGKTLAMIFDKSSTRTRVSFEAGMAQLGGHALFLAPGNTQMGRGEPIRDTARCLSRYVDGVMIRTFAQANIEEFVRYSSVPVINGLSDSYHPCQVMADLLTVIEHKGGYEGLRYCWIGDGNNMANSWINAAAVFGFELRVATPQGYEPDAAVCARAAAMGARILYTKDPLEAADGADVLNTDVWASMGQEAEQQQRARDFQSFQINMATVAAAAPESIVMHCLPAHRDEEITDEVIESRHSVIFDQAGNRLHVQKAIMVALMQGPAGAATCC